LRAIGSKTEGGEKNHTRLHQRGRFREKKSKEALIAARKEIDHAEKKDPSLQMVD
jgi:hypothetical protein